MPFFAAAIFFVIHFQIWIFTVSIGYIKISFIDTRSSNSSIKPRFNLTRFIYFFNRKTCLKYPKCYENC